MRLAGICVFITGGAGGIGTAFARKLMENGANVCLADVDDTKGRQLAEDLNSAFSTERTIFVKCDITEKESFKKAVETCVATFDHIDVMVNNAGLFDESCWEKMLLVNLVLDLFMGSRSSLLRNMAWLDTQEQWRTPSEAVKIYRRGCQQMCTTANTRPIDPVESAEVKWEIGPRTEILAESICAKHMTYDISFQNVKRSCRLFIVSDYIRPQTAPDVEKLGVRYACICPEAVDTAILNIQPNNVVERFYDDALKRFNAGKMRPETIAEGLVSLIKDDGSNDTLLHISLKDGSVRKRVLVEELK